MEYRLRNNTSKPFNFDGRIHYTGMILSYPAVIYNNPLIQKLLREYKLILIQD